jgi:hypothetical protein
MSDKRSRRDAGEVLGEDMYGGWAKPYPGLITEELVATVIMSHLPKEYARAIYSNKGTYTNAGAHVALLNSAGSPPLLAILSHHDRVALPLSRVRFVLSCTTSAKTRELLYKGCTAVQHALNRRDGPLLSLLVVPLVPKNVWIYSHRVTRDETRLKQFPTLSSGCRHCRPISTDVAWKIQ